MTKALKFLHIIYWYWIIPYGKLIFVLVVSLVVTMDKYEVLMLTILLYVFDLNFDRIKKTYPEQYK